MTSAQTILEQGRQRGAAAAMPYAGALTPSESYAVLVADPSVLLIDVRTYAERDWIGKVHLPATQHRAVQWNFYPGGMQNPEFLAELNAAAPHDAVLLFLCRSGVRSRHAAKLATENGYPHCFDVLEGFEGDRDGAGHRKTIAGWCYAGLPWIGA